MRTALLALLALATVAACHHDDSPAPVQQSTRKEITPPHWNGDCDPLVPYHCGFPFPTNAQTVDDASTKTGKRVQLKAGSLPMHNGKQTDPSAWSDHDGFSPNQNIVTLLPYATTTGLPSQDTIPLSVTKDSPTILMDATTGELVPHFAELDVAGKNTDDQTFMIRPVVRLKDATRYVVAIRHVVDPDGAQIPPSPAFQALRDGGASNEPSIEARRALYGDIFGILSKNGIAKNDLQIAWDFTTASRDNITREMIAMRDDALKTVGDQGPEYVIDSVEDNPNEFIMKRIHAKMTVPLYLDKADPPSKLVRDDKGLPKQNGTAQFEVLIHIPNAAKTQSCALLQNGHGLLGSKTEGQNGYLAKRAQDGCFVAFSVDLVGFASADQTVVSDQMVGDIGTFKNTVDRQHQGVLNSLLAMRMMKGRFVNEPSIQFDGHSAIDPSKGAFYRGDSQGGIFGATYMALSTDVTRGVLGEPGAPYSMLLHRSEDFGPFFFLLTTVYEDEYDIELALGLTQMLWDHTEPGGFINGINADPFPGTPKHDVLLSVAIGDHQVTPLGAHIIARAVGAKNLTPVNRSVYGIPEAAGPINGSAMVEYDFHLPEAPKEDMPATKGDDPHDMVRELAPCMAQEKAWFFEGVIKNECDGKCDPT